MSKDAVDLLVARLEETNFILNILHTKSVSKTRKELILETLNNNTGTIIKALELEGEKNEVPAPLIYQADITFSPERQKDIIKAALLLEEIQDAFFLHNQLQPIINLLKNEH